MAGDGAAPGRMPWAADRQHDKICTVNSTARRDKLAQAEQGAADSVEYYRARTLISNAGRSIGGRVRRDVGDRHQSLRLKATL
jgi:hypothetical protein